MSNDNGPVGSLLLLFLPSIPALIGNKIYKLNFIELNFMVPSSCITANIPIAYQIYTKVSPAIYHSEMV